MIGQAWARLGRLREIVAVGLCALLSLLLHAHFMLPWLGESDAARFGRIAFLWHSQGKISFDVGYQIRTSTLYLQLETLALNHGLPLHSLPSVINWVSVVLGTFCSVALYALFRKLTTRPIAVAATLVYWLTPGFWLGNIYGMPTVPGMLFFVLGLIAFLAAARGGHRGLPLLGQLVLSWLCVTVAMLLKSDLVLGGGAFLAVAFVRPTQRLRFACYAGAVVIGATLASIGYGHFVVQPSTLARTPSMGLLVFLKNWNKAFEVDLNALLTDSNNTTISRCVGGLLFSVIVFAHLYGLVTGGRLRKQALLALLWGLPPILAWGVRFGNSARHNVPAFPPLILFTVIVIFEITKQDVRRAAALIACTLSASYFSNTAGNDSLKPQSNLLELTAVMQKYSASVEQRGRGLAASPALKRVVIAGYADAFTEFQVLAAAKKPVLDTTGHLTVIDGDQITIIDASAYARTISAKALARRYQREGFEVLSMSYSL
jgi:Dolichyl-phosphate-mannose-protein mannosyltransferase